VTAVVLKAVETGLVEGLGAVRPKLAFPINDLLPHEAVAAVDSLQDVDLLRSLREEARQKKVQEAIKLLHPGAGLPTLAGKGFFFDGRTYDCFTIDYSRRDDCLSHETFGNIVETGLASETATLADAAKEAARHVVGHPIIDLPCEMVTELRCSKCGTTEEFYRLVRSVTVEEARCPSCGEVRTPEVVYEYAWSPSRAGFGTETLPKHSSSVSALGSRALAELGFGIMDVIAARCDGLEVQIEISGDYASLIRGAVKKTSP